MKSKPCRLGELDLERHRPLGVRDEIRKNLIGKIRAGGRLFEGVVGFEDTVVPQVVNALLARHDIIFLGLRGQAKTRLCRLLVELLDEEVPAVVGSPLREHPLAPVLDQTRARIADAGPDLPIEWIPREARYGEKLATPDVTMADLIGDIDPLKAAHRRLDLSDEQVIQFGIIPRTNRGIFAVNELPDLAPRIQVGLLNILEERDIQIRGFPIRFPLDVVLVFTANPEDYTNRGSIITPLKDRIASQILTHYPRTLDVARAITEKESWCSRDDGLPAVRIPEFLLDVLEEIAFSGRQSEYVDQKSGVSARLSIAAREILVSQVERRLIRSPSAEPVPRIVDLMQVAPAVTGKVELVYEGEEEGSLKVTRHLIGVACRKVFDRLFPDAMHDGDDSPAPNASPNAKSQRARQAMKQKPPRSARYKPVLEWFGQGKRLELSDESSDADHAAALEQVPGLARLVEEFLPSSASSRAVRCAAMELVLEGLHQHSLLAKEDLATGASYTDMLNVMLEGLE